MTQIQNPVTLSATGATLLNAGGANLSPDGMALSITVTGTNSLVLAQNTAPPGSAVSLTDVAYLNGSLVAQSAGTPITASGVYYIAAANASLDLWGTNTWTSGSVVISISPASIGGGGGAGGPVPAGDVTSGTFGANTGDVGDYEVPDDFTVADLLTTNGTSTELSQAATTSAVNVGAGTNSGATVLRIRGAAGQTRTLSWRTGAAAAGDRWAIVAGATAESGANAGSNWSLNAYSDTGVLIDQPLFVTRAAAGAIYTATGRSVGIAAPAAAISLTKITKAVTAIADNVATTVLTITVPNAAHSAVIRVTACGVLGAGGAIGAGEANASNSYDITVVRTAGVNAVADISTAWGVNAAAVAGAATCTAALTVAAVSGAVGATNTFPVQITIVKSGGASDNHTAFLTAEVLNQNATGVSIA